MDLTTSSGDTPESPPLRVLVVAEGAPEQGGIPTFVDGLMKPGLFGDTATLTLFNTTRAASEGRREAGALSLGNVRKTVSDAWRTFRMARVNDVVHVQSSPLPIGPLLRAGALCAAGRLAGAGVVLHIHASLESRGNAFEQSPAYRRLLPVLRAAHRGVTVTDVAKRLLGERLPGWPVTTIHNAVDAASFLVADPGRAEPKFVYVGRLMIGKGLLDLFDSLSSLSRAQRPAEMTVVGGSAATRSEEAAEIEQAAATCPAPIVMTGPLDTDEVKDVLADSQAFVLPSHFEGQPISVLEAMASGLPVLVTDVGSNSQVVRDGVDGLVVSAHDVAAMAEAIETLVTDPGLRSKMGASARQRVLEQYDLPRLASDLLGQYRLARAQVRRRRVAARCRSLMSGRSGRVRRNRKVA